MRKIRLVQRVVYHKVGEIYIDIPNDIKDEDVEDWLMNNENDWYDDLAESVYECSLNLGDGYNDDDECWTDRDEETETRYDIERGGKIVYGGHV